MHREIARKSMCSIFVPEAVVSFDELLFFYERGHIHAYIIGYIWCILCSSKMPERGGGWGYG